MGLKANADGSGAVQVGGSNAITITSGLNTTFAGTIAVAGSATALYPLVSGTAVASTSGTSIDFTGIPSTVKRITVMCNGVSTNGTGAIIVQLGSTTFTVSGYSGAVATIVSSTPTASSLSTGFQVGASISAASTLFGSLIITNITGNVWTGMGVVGRGNESRCEYVGGAVTLSGTLDRVRITTVNGTDVFDAGTVNIMWE